MASLQAYQSHGIRYFRIVESFRKNGKPAIRVLAHLGRVDDILQLHQGQHSAPFPISSVSAGAVTALHHLATELDLAGRINACTAPDCLDTTLFKLQSPEGAPGELGLGSGSPVFQPATAGCTW